MRTDPGCRAYRGEARERAKAHRSSKPKFLALALSPMKLHVPYANSFRFMLEDAVRDMRGVNDVTNPVSSAAKELL
jgi:hypothetical protein